MNPPSASKVTFRRQKFLSEFESHPLSTRKSFCDFFNLINRADAISSVKSGVMMLLYSNVLDKAQVEKQNYANKKSHA